MDEFIRAPYQNRAKELTTRQRQVLQLLAEGHSIKEAAEILNIAVRTIAFHKYRIMEDFGLTTNSDLVVSPCENTLFRAFSDALL